MSEPRGAGSAGGLLFVVVLLFVGFLVLRALVGLVRIAVTAVILVAVISLVVRALDRR